jgi:hypothetical protein
MASFDFTNATVLSYNQVSNFLGDGVARLSSTREISIEVLERNAVVANIDNEGVSQSWGSFKEALEACNNFAEDIVLNGFRLGKGRVSSAAIIDENPVRKGLHRINISVPTRYFSEAEATQNQDTSILGGKYYVRFHQNLGSDRHLLKQLTEDFSSNVDEDNELEQTHSLTIQYSGDISGGAIDSARDLANSLFNYSNSAPEFGFLNGEEGANASFSKHSSKKHYFTESYDLMTKVCQFTKTYKSDQNEDDYSLKIRTTINLQADGVVTVTERGEIKAETFEEAQDAVDTEIAVSHTRCQAAFDAYADDFLGSKYGGGHSIGQGPNAALLNTPIETGKEYVRKSKRASYTVVYSNYVRLGDGHLLEYTLNHSEAQSGKVTISESGTVRPYHSEEAFSTTGVANRVPTYLETTVAASFNRAKEFYKNQGFNEIHLKPIRSDLQYSQSSMTMVYTKEYSDDVALRFVDVASGEGPGEVSGSSLFKRMNITVSDQLPIFMRKSYVIPNKDDGFSLVHEPEDGIGGQTNMGQRSVTIDSIIPRPPSNTFTTIPNISSQLTKCKKIAAQKGADIISDFELDAEKTYIYAEDCTYNFDNRMALSFTVVFNYTTARDSEDVTTMGILTQEL